MPKAAPPADTAPPPRPQRALSYVDSLTPHLFVPSAERPVRAKVRQLAADTQVMPHSHPWAQVAISTTGGIRLTVDRGTYIVPPSRALWIPPGVEHAVTMVEDADLRTLYFHQPRGRCGPGVPRHQEAAWRQCRVLEVSVAGYHEHFVRQASAAQRRHLSDDALLVHIKAIHAETRGGYGWPRTWKELLARGIRVGKERVQKLMKLHGCLLYTSPSPRDRTRSRMPSSA